MRGNGSIVRHAAIMVAGHGGRCLAIAVAPRVKNKRLGHDRITAESESATRGFECFNAGRLFISTVILFGEYGFAHSGRRMRRSSQRVAGVAEMRIAAVLRAGNLRCIERQSIQYSDAALILCRVRRRGVEGLCDFNLAAPAVRVAGFHGIGR